MAFCSKCGAQLNEGEKFCSKCGAPVEDKKEEKKQENGFEAILNTPDTTSGYDQNDIQSNKAMGILAYLGLLVLVPILAAKNSRFARFHANQGLVLLIVEIGFSIISALKNIHFIGGVFGVVGALGSIVTLALAIIGIVNAAQGKVKELPVIGGIKILQ